VALKSNEVINIHNSLTEKFTALQTEEENVFPAKRKLHLKLKYEIPAYSDRASICHIERVGFFGHVSLSGPK
jgi:hypothetical protein